MADSIIGDVLERKDSSLDYTELENIILGWNEKAQMRFFKAYEESIKKVMSKNFYDKMKSLAIVEEL